MPAASNLWEIADLSWELAKARMHIERAYCERETLSDVDLERLRAALADQVERYEFAVRNYPPERMERYGKPYLTKLQQKVIVVDALIKARTDS